MRFNLLFLAIVFLLTTGCSQGSLLRLADALNERQIKSCLEYNGAINFGAGVGGSSGSLHGITVTGGAEFELCSQLLR